MVNLVNSFEKFFEEMEETGTGELSLIMPAEQVEEFCKSFIKE